MQWLGDNPWAAWLALAALLGIAELASLDLVLVMLAVAASIAMLVVVRPAIARRLQTGPELVLGSANLLGKQAVTPVRLSTHQPGQLKIDGELWTAKPYDEMLVIEPGETVEVLLIKGATAYVHPVPTLES